MKEEELKEAQECLTFIEESISCFHAVENVEKRLQKKGFIELSEKEAYDLTERRKKAPEQNRYYVKRNGSSLMAFTLPEGKPKGFHIMASHSDSPTFKVKCEGEMKAEGGYVRLNVEPYGGMIHATWLDRCLSVAGRIVCQKGDQLLSKTVNVDEDLLVIPNVAIHMNRQANDGYKWNPVTDVLPLLASPESKGKFAELLEKEAGGRILSHDLFLYIRQKASVWGLDESFLSSAALDDLECVWGCFQGFLRSSTGHSIPLFAALDSEEVGSCSPQGAASTLLYQTISRIAQALSLDENRLLAQSFLVSADNAHAQHPNHPELADSGNAPKMGGGIVIKFNANLRYCTDGLSAAVMRTVCRKAGVASQNYYNRPDIPGGSTLGCISIGQVSVPTADIGLAQLAMHSCYETAAVSDAIALEDAMTVYFGSTLRRSEDSFTLE